MAAAADAAVAEVLAARSLYDALGVARDVTDEEVRRAYIQRSRLVHPDKCVHPQAKHAFQVVSHAYRTLSDPVLRARYDQTGAAPDDSPSPMLDALLNEFLEGEFDRILMLLELALQANVINLKIDKDALRESLSDLHRSVTFLLKYRDLLRVDLLKLAEVQSTWRTMPMTDLPGQLRSGVAFTQAVLSMLARIDDPALDVMRGRLRFVANGLQAALEGVDRSVIAIDRLGRAAVERIRGHRFSPLSPLSWLLLGLQVVYFVWAAFVALFFTRRNAPAHQLVA